MSAHERLHSLDAVRAFALLAGVVLHAAMSFLPGFAATGWPIADNSPSVPLGVTFFVIHMFRMTTFFLIAGYFGHMLFHRLGIARVRAQPQPAHRRSARRRMDGGVPGDRGIVHVGSQQGPLHLRSRPLPPPPTLAFPLTHLWFLYVLVAGCTRSRWQRGRCSSARSIPGRCCARGSIAWCRR